MRKSVFRKVSNTELYRNCRTLYLTKKFGRSFEFSKKIKILKFEGDWDESSTKISLRRQFWTKYLEQSKEINHNWTGAESFDKYFYVIFSRITKVLFLE